MDPLKILRKGLWITIINLAVADLVVCVSVLRFTQYFDLLFLAVSASFMLLAFFSLQVYTITKFPFKARHFWTRTKVVLCCVGIWLLAGLLVFVSIFRIERLVVQYLFWGIIVIIQVVLKILTCWEIFKTRRNSGQSQSSRHRKITTTVMIMVAIQMFTAFPFVVLLQLQYEESNEHLFAKILTYHMPLALLNFCVNPIIYFLRLPDYRSSLLSLCGCRKCKNQTSSDPQRNEQRELPLLQVPPTTSKPPS